MLISLEDNHKVAEIGWSGLATTGTTPRPWRGPMLVLDDLLLFDLMFNKF
jgi:hypothetical protein